MINFTDGVIFIPSRSLSLSFCLTHVHTHQLLVMDTLSVYSGSLIMELMVSLDNHSSSLCNAKFTMHT